MPVSTHPKLLALLSILAVVILPAAEKTESPVVIAHGETFAISDYLVPGKTVVFGFISDYSPPCPCGHCHELEDPLQALHTSREDVVVVKVEIDRLGVTKIDWNSPVALQYGLRRVPHFLVFGPEGEVVAADGHATTEAEARDLVHEMLVSLPDHTD